MEAQKVTDPILENQLLDLEYLILSKRWTAEKIEDPFAYRKELSVERMDEILKSAIIRKGILSFQREKDEIIVYLNGERI